MNKCSLTLKNKRKLEIFEKKVGTRKLFGSTREELTDKRDLRKEKCQDLYS